MKLKSIRSKVMASIICITFLTAIAIAVVFYNKSSRMIEENYTTVLRQRAQLLTATIDGTLKDIYGINVNASCDQGIERAIEQYLINSDEQELEQIADKLRAYEKQNNYISSLYLLIPEKGQVVTSKDYPVYRSKIDHNKLLELIESARNRAGPVIASDMLSEGKSVLTFMESIKNGEGREIGYMCINMDENKLFYDFFNDTTDKNLKDFVLLNGAQVVASAKMTQLGTVFDEKKELEYWLIDNNAVGADKEHIYIICQGAFSGCRLFVRAEKKLILSDLIQMRTYILGIVAVFVILSLIPAIYITQVVYQPVKKLTTAIQMVSQGELETRVEIVSSDEIGIMSAEFNRMLDQIDELILRLLKEEEMKKDAELEALQYQITPHFMYNTLNSIKCAAYIKGEKEIANVINDFVELLQTCISKRGAFLTVAEEINVLQNYICLQEFRNGESIQVSCQIQSEAQQCLIPRLILQPLVENALLHGIDSKIRQGILVVRARVENSVLFLEVEDNGRGMSEEQIQSLLTSKVKKTNGLNAVGIPNVRERLKLYYKEKAELSYESSEKGTTAAICLPAIQQEESIIGG